MKIWRYSGNGTLDPGFDVSHPGNAGFGFGETVGLGVATDSTGRIIVCGYSVGSDGLWGMTLWRYLANGTLDTTFAGTGYVRDTARQGGGVSCVVDGSGRLVVAGFAWNGVNWDMAVWRYAGNGTPDTSFGAQSNGYVSHNGAAGGDSEDVAIGVAIDNSGRILLTGYSTNAAGDEDMALWRYSSSDGSLDTSFNATGFVTHADAAGSAGGNDVGRAIAIDPVDGDIVVTGWSPSQSGADDITIWRLNSTGSLDSAFNGGYVSHNGAAGGSGTDEGRAVVIDSARRIIVAGASTNAAGDSDFTVWRYLVSGALDQVTVYPGGVSGTDDGGRDLGMDTLGRLWAVGFRSPSAFAKEPVLWSLGP
jgi:uncharacterized delta-60 repeat protein